MQLMPSAQRFKQEVDILIRARYPIIYVLSWEEHRVEAALRELAGERRDFYSWSVTSPFGKPVGSSPRPEDAAREALQALDHILRNLNESQRPALFLLKDFDRFLSDTVVVRKLRDVAAALKSSYKTVIIVSPNLEVPLYLEKEITVVDFGLPNLADMTEILGDLVRAVERNPNITIALDEPGREHLLKAALGLTADEAAKVFAKALVVDRRLDDVDIQVVLSEKQQIIRKTGILEYYEADEGLADVGGVDNLKDWLRKRTAAFSEKARAFGLPQPRGILLLGVQGCGKSLCAKAVSGLWGLPLLRFDVGNVFGKYVGESEANMRKATRIAESISPCVLWIDELEKAFSGAGDASDGGATQRVVAYFLTWLQEKTAPVFVVATANDISRLPPELLRKGRLDEIFYVDLPSRIERRDIFAIHLSKRKRNADEFDLDALAAASAGFSGAEIEQVIIEAMYDAFDQSREVTTEDMLSTLETSVPLYHTMGEQILVLRQWAESRARWASKHPFTQEEESDA